MEQVIIAAAIKSRTAFNQLEKLDARNDMSPMARSVFDALRDYYQADPRADSADLGLLRDRLASGLSNPKHRDATVAFLGGLEVTATSAPNVVQSVRDVRLRNLGYEIATMLGSGGARDATQLLMERYLDLSYAADEPEADDVLHGLALEDLEAKVTAGATIPLAPKALSVKVGGNLIRGNHVVVFGRPNKGKSAFVINQAAVCLHKGLKVLFVENEDPAPTTILRLLSRLTERPREAMFADKKGTGQLARERGYENFFLADLSPGNYREIRAIAEEKKPDVIILNQIRNFSVGDAPRHEQLEKAAIQARNLAKSMNACVFSVTQAGDSATNKLYPVMEDIDNSKTGINGAVDLGIGIGTNAELESRGQLILNIAKNKLNNIHEGVHCRIEPAISKITGLQ